MTPYSQKNQLFWHQKLIIRSLMLGSCLLPLGALAQDANFLPHEFGATISGSTGSTSMGYADLMLPLIGQSTSFFYLDPQALYHNSDAYSGSLGAGYRQLVSQEMGILGAYVFGDYNRSTNGNNFWFVSPGVERLGECIDFSANLYIPVSTQKEDLGTVFGQDINQYEFITFQGHTEFDQTFNSYESVGMGGDAEIGIRIPMLNNPKLYVGGYYFNPEDADSITGGTARLEIPITDRFSLTVSDGYDNLAHNTWKIGASYSFGGRNTSKNFKGDLAKRMVDPIHRNLMAVSGSAHTAQPIEQTNLATGDLVVVLDNISFFEPGTAPGVQGNGTFENPYIGFTQDTVDAGNDAGNRNFFVDGGIYMPGSSVVLTNDSVFGREDYKGRAFVKPAEGNNRPLFNFTGNGFILAGTHNAFDSVRLLGNDTGDGIFFENNGAQTLSLAINNTDIQHFLHALAAVNNSTGVIDVDITKSSFHDNSNDGIFAQNSDGGTLNLSASQSSFDFNNSHGAVAFNSSTGTINFSFNESSLDNNTFQGLFIQNSSTGTVDLFASNTSFDENGLQGIFLLNNGTTEIDVTQSSFDENGQAGVTLTNIGAATLDFTASQSSFNGNGIRGMFLQNNVGLANVNIDQSSFDDNGSHGLFVVMAGGTGTTNIDVAESSFNENDTGISLTNTGAGTLNFIADQSSVNDNSANGLFVTTGLGASTTNINVTESSFDGNGAQGVAVIKNGNSILNFTADQSSFNNNVGAGAFISRNGSGSLNFTANESSFDDNGLEGLVVNSSSNSGTTNVTVTESSFNGNGGEGVSLINLGTAAFNFTGSQSSFNDNGTYGLDIENSFNGSMNIIVNDSTFNDNVIDGVLARNSGSGILNFTATDSTFNNNGQYGVAGFNNLLDDTKMSITLNQSTLLGNGVAPTNMAPGDGITWTINP